MNRALLIRMIREMRTCSRADLARATGLKQSTITNIVTDLINLELVRETGLMEGVRGRRSIALEFYGHTYKVIGVKLSRKRISVGLFDIAGNEYQVLEHKIDSLVSPVEAIKKMVEMIRKLLQAIEKNNKVVGIGLALPGPFISKEGRIVLMTEFPGWEQISIRTELEAVFDLPIFAEHDANVGALAEWTYGHHHHMKGTMIYVAAGQGIGAGIVIDGELFSGSLGTAGEIGHMSINFDGPACQCGNFGCLELYCSTTAMSKLADEQSALYTGTVLPMKPNLDDLMDAYKQEDELAQKIVKDAVHYLGLGLVNVVNAFNPDRIIIGDDMARLGDELLEAVRSTVRKHVLSSISEKLSIELTSFERDPALIGAATLVTNQMLNRPSSLISSRISS
jgi:predicted NBD/HSP70 family sugar kinase